MASGRAILSCHDKRGKLQRTIDVTDELLAGAAACPATPLCLAALPHGVALALGKRLVLTRGDGGLARFELPGRAVRLCATLPHTRQGIAVMLEVGAVFHWLGAEGFIELDRDLESPKAVFAPGGPLAILSDSRAVLFDVDAQGVCGLTRVELTMPRPVGISATDHPGQFAILGAGGEMTVYHLPR